MRKRLFSMALCVLFALTLALPARAQEEEEFEREITISTRKDFLRFAEKCRLDSYSQGLKVSLKADLDLEGAEFEGIPIFCGSFEGNGHTIRGFCVTSDGSGKGLFRYLTASAQVRELNVQAQIHPGGTRAEVGGIAGSNSGSIVRCTFSGEISGGSYVGGIAGKNTVTGLLENCRMDGQLQGEHFVGGIAGENQGVIRGCVNRAEINTTAQQNTVELSDITLDSIRNSEASNTVTDIGGIAGISTGVIRSCTNEQTVGYRQMGYNIGGIAGTQSGYIVDCENKADVFGRKEVGGIVGQMEPSSTMVFVEDTLQILKEQLSTLSGMVSRASGNAQGNAGAIFDQLGNLTDEVESARKALESLLPSAENPSLPDADAIAAAQNALSASLRNMSKSIRKAAGAVTDTASGIAQDMRGIQGQMSAMGETISRASEHVGGRLVDVSDQDQPELLSGKVERCRNQGAVLADRNAGGVTGAMAPENDLDLLEDWQVVGQESLNFESEVRAVVLSCSNSGTVTAKKQNGGGIAGWQSMGLVKQCVNTGSLTEENAQYIGGITGRSAGYIRQCSVKCTLDGKDYVGGIAGSAGIVSDCRSMVQILSEGEGIGGILGLRESTQEQDEEPALQGNCYLVTTRDYGGIDGISYDGEAQPISEKRFFALEDVPKDFRYARLTFVQEDGTKTVRKVKAGDSLAPENIPQVSAKDAMVGSWDGVGSRGVEKVYFDQVFRAQYVMDLSVVESRELRGGKPVMLLEGIFPLDWTLKLTEPKDSPRLSEGQVLLDCESFSPTEDSVVTRGRYLLPGGQEPEHLALYVRDAQGQWRSASFEVDESYLVFPLETGDNAVAAVLADQGRTALGWIAAAGGMGVLVVALIVQRKRKAAGSRNNPDAEETQP